MSFTISLTAAQTQFLQQAFYNSIYKNIMSPRKRHKWQVAKEKDPLLDLDTKIRAALLRDRNRCYTDDWWPRMGSEDEALLITYGMTEFIQGIVEEEDRFRRSWEER